VFLINNQASFGKKLTVDLTCGALFAPLGLNELLCARFVCAAISKA
jgi:hypothetical protein